MLSREELDAVLAPTGARPLPARAYLDDALFALERSAMFDRAWLYVGRERDVALPGAWVRTPFAAGRVVVVRGEDLKLRALYDVCLHRGATLTEGPCGRTGRFTCPYHGWTYDLRGALRSAPDMPETFDAKRSLKPARVDTFRGFVFVTLDEDAPPLRDALAPLPPWLERASLDALVAGYTKTWDVDANWKLLVENYQEAHHFPTVHPGLEHHTPARDTSSLVRFGHAGRSTEGPWLGGTMDLIDEVETVSQDGLRHDRPFIVPSEDRRRVHDAMLFPGLLTSLQPDYLLTYRLWPLAVDRTRITFEVLYHPTATPGDAVHAFWEVTNAEDRAICESQQRGIRSGAWSPLAYATVEDGMHAFDRLVARAYGRCLP